MFPLPSLHCLILLGLVLGSLHWGVIVGEKWNQNWVLSTDEDSAVVWLGRVDETCVARLSSSLACR